MSGLVSRREVLRGLGGVAAAGALRGSGFAGAEGGGERPLAEVEYGQVTVLGERQRAQRENVRSVLMGMSDDSLLKPFRAMAGRPGLGAERGAELGGWYAYIPGYQPGVWDAGFAPGSTFGQWTSALARLGAGDGAEGGGAEELEKVRRVHGLLGEAIAQEFFAKTRFPAYTFDKLVCGLKDGQRLAGDTAAFAVMNKVTAAAEPELPEWVVERDVVWREKGALSYVWDEAYTLPENLYLLSAQMRGGGESRRYRVLAKRYMDDVLYFEPLARGEDVLAGKHAYSFVNALCSAMQAYLVEGSGMHLRAAKNGFALVEQQSFATGGWGPDEMLRAKGTDAVEASLTTSHNSFETPCGGYAHMKLTRYLLRVTRDGHYGDSMERVMWNAVMGSLPLEADGRSFYYADYNDAGKKVYSAHRWPCCSGTLPQVVADYGINSYFREPGAMWVNLYQASAMRWTEGGARVEMVQDGSYPYGDVARLRLTCSRAVEFGLCLRVPEWGEGTQVRVNGRVVEVRAVKGFVRVRRTWRTGDEVEILFPMRLRLEMLGKDRAALMSGPLVLFAVGAGAVTCSRAEALAAEKVSGTEWRLGGRRMVPFTEVGEEGYATYLRLRG